MNFLLSVDIYQLKIKTIFFLGVFAMEIEIREIEVEDYRELLDFMKKVKRETNFLQELNQ